MVVVGLVAAQPSATGTSPSPQEPTFRTGVDVVQLDVTVLDRDRKPVRGLTAADFTLLEDNESRRIVSFEPIELPSRLPADAEGFAAVTSDVTSNQHDTQRLVVIVFDDANTGGNVGLGRDPWIMRSGKQIARDVVNGLGPNDLAAVVFTNIGRPQNFTTDRSRLLSAIDSFVPQGGSAVGPPLACDYKGPEGNCVLATLRHVAEALPSSPPRRKVLVFISQGHRLPFLSSDEDGELNLPSSAQLLQIDYLQQMLRALQRANVTVYAYSPGGLQVHGGAGEASLRGLAEHTGGRATVQTNTPWTAVPAMFEETGSYYLIGFETTRTDGRFHTVDVRVSRPDATVQARTGYFAPAGAVPTRNEGADAGALAPVDVALSGGLPSAALPLSAIAAARPVPGERDAEVTVVTRVDVPPAEVGMPSPTVELSALAFDRNWRERAFDRRTVEITRPAGTAPDAPAEIVSTLRLRPGRYELRIAADTGGRAGSVYLDLDIPNFAGDELSLSGPMVTAGRPDAIGTRTLPAFTTQRTFRHAESIAVLTHVWQGGRGRLEAVAATARIVDAAGRQVWRRDASLQATAFAAGRSALHVVQLPLADLTPGNYALTIDVTRGDRTISRHVRFAVR